MSALGVAHGSIETEAPTASTLLSFSSRPDGGLFVKEGFEEQGQSADRIFITQESGRAEIEELMRTVPVFQDLIAHYKPDEGRIEGMLRTFNINRHDFAHQQRVAGMAMAMGRFFKIPDDRRKAVGLAASFHDMGYVLPEGASMQTVGKKDFDKHAELGADMFEDLFMDPRFRSYFRDWSEDMKRDAVLSIKYHNGSSFNEYHSYRSQIPLGPKLVRAADHMDNMQDRIRWDRITPEGMGQDDLPEHRLVPAAIGEVGVLIDQSRKLVEIVHRIDRNRMHEQLRDSYSIGELRGGFRRAYGRKIAGVQGVFEDAMQYPATDEEQMTANVVFVTEQGENIRDPMATME